MLFDLSNAFASFIPGIFLPLLITGLVVSAMGFFRVVWFISTGYGYSIAAMAVVTVIAAFQSGIDAAAHPAFLVQALFLAIYGIRLGTFLVYRDLQQSFKGEVAAVRELNARIPRGAQFGIWLTVAALYAVMVAPLVYHAKGLGLADTSGGVGFMEGFWNGAGLLIMFSGLVLESTADLQKSAAKKQRPDRFVDTGVFRMVRYPNYFGEILVWTGSWVTAIGYYTHWSHWLVSAAGFVIIFLIMMGSAKRLELKQEHRYGKDPEFQAYAQRVPVLFPLIPLYSLKNVKFAIGWGSHDFGSKETDALSARR